ESGRPKVLIQIPSALDGLTESPQKYISRSNSLSAMSTNESSDSNMQALTANRSRSSSSFGPLETKHIRFEKLSDGSHKHHLNAPKRHQFLFQQFKKLKEHLGLDSHSHQSSPSPQPQPQQHQQHQ